MAVNQRKIWRRIRVLRNLRDAGMYSRVAGSRYLEACETFENMVEGQFKRGRLNTACLDALSMHGHMTLTLRVQ